MQTWYNANWYDSLLKAWLLNHSSELTNWLNYSSQLQNYQSADTRLADCILESLIKIAPGIVLVLL